jgi:predicted CXXCH cytochrome family protein
MKVFRSNLTRWVGGLAIGLVFGMSGVAYAAATGIAATKHNLSSGGPGPNKTDATDQICVFCHTPHGSDTSAAVPLWNKKLTSGPFQVYNSTAASATSSLDGEILAVGSVSIACLSCHDGTQAMDNMLNKPGTGGYNAAGSSLGGTWTGAATMTGTPIPVLGTDLRNDHPIGIQYCGGGLTGSGTTVSGTCNDSDFIGPSTRADSHFSNAVVKTKEINASPVFWVETGTVNTTREKTDISLYTRAFTAATGPSVECGSCHDPHVDSKGSDNIMFMRVTTAGSAICLSCHVK